MRILISGVCGFAGSAIARALAEQRPKARIVGFDNFIRPGSEGNRAELKRSACGSSTRTCAAASDVDALPACDWVIDAAANPSVLAGVDGRTSSRQLVEHNLCGTVNLLEYCKRNRAGFVLLSTSRVYSIAPLAELAVRVADGAFRPGQGASEAARAAAGSRGVFHRRARLPLRSDQARERGPRPGVRRRPSTCPSSSTGAASWPAPASSAGPDQGIFAYWINSQLRRRPLRYIGFGGKGHQVRDCLHPHDLVPLLGRSSCAPKIASCRQRS